MENLIKTSKEDIRIDIEDKIILHRLPYMKMDVKIRRFWNNVLYFITFLLALDQKSIGIMISITSCIITPLTNFILPGILFSHFYSREARKQYSSFSPKHNQFDCLSEIQAVFSESCTEDHISPFFRYFKNIHSIAKMRSNKLTKEGVLSK